MTTRAFSYARYGIRSGKLERIKDLVARALGREFGGHDSEYWDIYYTTSAAEEPRIEIKRNWDFSEKLPHWPQHKEFEIVISIYRANEYATTDKALTSDPRIDATLLEHENAFREKAN